MMEKMRMAMLLVMALTLVFLPVQAETGYTLYDTERGGAYRMEPCSGDAAMESGEYSNCTIVFDESSWSYVFEKDGETANLYCDRLVSCPEPSAAVTRYSPLICGMMPESIEDVARMNRAMTLLPQSQYFAVTLENVGTGTLPVYTAPSTKAHRAASGKASVGLSGEVVVLDWRDGWMMLFYELGGGRARVGWVQERRELIRTLENAGYEEEDFDSGIHRWGRMPAIAARLTSLSDNPNDQGEVLMTLEEGEAFTCLGRWGSLFAYVETEFNGKIARGFVPLRDVEIAEPQEDAQAIAQLAGTSWVFYAGGNMFADFQHYQADGMAAGGGYNYDAGGWFPEGQGWDLEPEMIDGWQAAAYTVSRYDPAWGLFWADVPYMITYTYENGRVDRYGLRFDGEALSLYTSEGSGGFMPYTGALDAVPQLVLRPAQAESGTGQ